MPGTLFVVATPIGNLEDITLRALKVLRDVTLIAAEDTRRTANLLARHAIETPTTSFHAHNEHRKTAAIVARLAQGEDVALVSDAGTPTVSDPGAPLIRAARAAGIRIVPIPGPSAVLTALSALGIGSPTFTFLGFPPNKSKDRKYWFKQLRSARGTVVFFEAPHRIRTTMEELQATIGDREVFIGRELTKVHETLVKCHISNFLSEPQRPLGEFTVVLELGQNTEIEIPDDPARTESRRQALAAVAKDHGLTANQLYEAIEHAKKSVK